MFSSVNVYSGWKDAGAGRDGEQVILITNQADRVPIIVNSVFSSLLSLLFLMFLAFNGDDDLEDDDVESVIPFCFWVTDS